MSEKLQKNLAQRGLGARRQMEEWIRAGRVTVNGHVASLGARVTPADRIGVDGRRLPPLAPPRPRIWVLNKPDGVVCTRRDPDGRRTVFELLPRLGGGRWLSVGRLDVHTTGLLMLTNDGALAHRLMHPSTGLDREYAVRLDGKLSDAALTELKAGVAIDGVVQRFSDVRYYDGRGANHWYHVVLMEGRNREVRKLFDALGRTVTRLKRVRFGPVVLPSWLKRGQVSEMGPTDVRDLSALLGLPTPAAPAKGRRKTPSLLIPYPELTPRPATSLTGAPAKSPRQSSAP